MSSYYYAPKVDPCLRASEDADLKKQIEEIHEEFPYYGTEDFMSTFLKQLEKLSMRRRSGG